jgi:hypothetical protein
MKTRMLDIEEFQKAISNPVNIDEAISMLWDILCRFQKPVTTWAIQTDKIVDKRFMFLERIEEVKINVKVKESIIIHRQDDSGRSIFKYEIEKYYPIEGCTGTLDVVQTYFKIRDEIVQLFVSSYQSKRQFISAVVGEIYTWGTEFNPSLQSLISVKLHNDFSNIYNTYIPYSKKI